jgi:hypothetical protein
MRKYLLAATAAIAMVTGAAAQTMDDTENNAKKTYWWYECSVAKVTPPDKGDKDPGYKINLYLDTQDNSFVKVVHTTRSGKEYNRADQYTVKDGDNTTNKKGASTWFGVNIKEPNLSMGGIFGKLPNGQLVYNEVLFRTGKKGPVMELNSVCHQI